MRMVWRIALSAIVLCNSVTMWKIAVPAHGAAVAGLSPEQIGSWGYDEATNALLLELYRGGQEGGAASVCWQLLAYVESHRPPLAWVEMADNGYTRARLGGGYEIHLSLRLQGLLVEPEMRSRAASTLAHEIRHALWNSVLDSNEEEFYCERTAGLAYEEMLRANGYSDEDAAFRARVVYPVLKMDVSTWITRFKWAPSGFDWAWQSDWARSGLDILCAFWPLGPLGHPIQASNRTLGK
jgi:hypothetical protein